MLFTQNLGFYNKSWYVSPFLFANTIRFLIHFSLSLSSLKDMTISDLVKNPILTLLPPKPPYSVIDLTSVTQSNKKHKYSSLE